MEVEGEIVRVCSAGSQEAQHFFEDPRLHRVPNRQYDLAIQWPGNHDIRRGTHVGELLGSLREITTAVKTRYQA